MKRDWDDIRRHIDERGFAVVPAMLDEAVCATIADSYADDGLFRSRVVMRRHSFGEGEYKYFGYPLPAPVQQLRESVYPELAPLANLWAERLSWERRFPDTHAAWLKTCHEAGQTRPTPLVLDYGPGDYNRLHQDLYGDLHFPVQMAVMLADPADFEGGEFVLTETQARKQNRAEVIALNRGDAVIFAVNQRPVPSKNGYSRVTMRHGVSTVRSGHRRTLGVIFHDAR